MLQNLVGWSGEPPPTTTTEIYLALNVSTAKAEKNMLENHVYIQHHFSSAPKFAFSISYSGVSIATQYYLCSIFVFVFVLAFVYLKISILLSFLKDNFSNYRISGWRFSLSTLNRMPSLPSDSQCFQRNQPFKKSHCSHYIIHIFSLFLRLLFTFGFQQFDYG